MRHSMFVVVMCVMCEMWFQLMQHNDLQIIGWAWRRGWRKRKDNGLIFAISIPFRGGWEKPNWLVFSSISNVRHLCCENNIKFDKIFKFRMSISLPSVSIFIPQINFIRIPNSAEFHANIDKSSWLCRFVHFSIWSAIKLMCQFPTKKKKHDEFPETTFIIQA